MQHLLRRLASNLFNGLRRRPTRTGSSLTIEVSTVPVVKTVNVTDPQLLKLDRWILRLLKLFCFIV